MNTITAPAPLSSYRNAGLLSGASFEYEDYSCTPLAAETGDDLTQPTGFLLSRSSGEVSLVTPAADGPSGLWNQLVEAMNQHIEPLVRRNLGMPTDYWYG
jgi:hypothetical protein